MSSIEEPRDIHWDKVSQAFGIPSQFEPHEWRPVSIVRQIALNILGYIPGVGTMKAVFHFSYTLLNPYSDFKGRALGITIRNAIEVTSGGLLILPFDLMITIRRLFNAVLS